MDTVQGSARILEKRRIRRNRGKLIVFNTIRGRVHVMEGLGTYAAATLIIARMLDVNFITVGESLLEGLFPSRIPRWILCANLVEVHPVSSLRTF